MAYDDMFRSDSTIFRSLRAICCMIYSSYGPVDGRIRLKHVVISHDIHVRHLAKEIKYLINCVLTDY